jgi:hypothetical protein
LGQRLRRGRALAAPRGRPRGAEPEVEAGLVPFGAAGAGETRGPRGRAALAERFGQTRLKNRRIRVRRVAGRGARVFQASRRQRQLRATKFQAGSVRAASAP